MSKEIEIDYKKLYIKEVSKYPILSKEKTLKLFEEMSCSTGIKKYEIRNEIVRSNQRLVLYVVKNYTGLGMDFYDLFREGCISLIEATEKFDYKRGNSFAPFAIRAIKHSIKNVYESKNT